VLPIVLIVLLAVFGWKQPKTVGAPLIASSVAGGLVLVSVPLAIGFGAIAFALWLYWLRQAAVLQPHKEPARRWHASTRDKNGLVTWRCEHSHMTQSEAAACAQQHLVGKAAAERTLAAKRQAQRDRQVKLKNQLLDAQVNELGTGTRCKKCGAIFDSTRGPCPYCTTSVAPTLGKVPAVTAQDKQLAAALRRGLAAIPGVHLLGPDLGTETLPVATFTVDGLPHSLVAARLSFEDAIGVRHGCFCAHPYLVRLLGLGPGEVAVNRARARRGDRSQMPGAVRASLGLNASVADVERLCAAVARLATLVPTPVTYVQDPGTGDFSPGPASAPWLAAMRQHGSSCSPG
jgi:hypothetical protein